MNKFNLSNNIIRLRHEKKLTQEALADFIGVTKASVSKWENAQSMPDILLLPQLASFFGVTIDELLGYEAQLSSEQIRRFYEELSGDFAALPFQEALEKVRVLAHRYYSCYPFLLQLAVLCLNHFMLAEAKETQRQILQEAILWCDRILENCSDVGVCSDAVSLKAGLSLQLGRAAEAIALLEPVSDLKRISRQNGSMLIQAYQAAGEMGKAKNYVQIEQYLSLLSLVGDALLLLSLYPDHLPRCEEVIQRAKGVMGLYQLEQLHPNLAAQFHYQSALVYVANQKQKEALEALGHFERCVSRLLGAEEAKLHGDRYFDLLDSWIECLPLGNMAPRDKSFIIQNAQAALSHPAFASLRERREFQKIACKLEEGGK